MEMQVGNMSRIVLLTVFCILAGLCAAQDTNPRFEPDMPNGYFQKAGSPLELKCQLDADAGFLVQQQLRIVHVSAKNNEERIISEQGSIMAPFDENDDFELNFQYIPSVYATLTIGAITDDLDGKFVCQVKPINEETIQESAEVGLVVAAGVESLELTIGDVTVTDLDEVVEREVGTVEVMCKVSGTNPQPLIQLTLDDQPLDFGDMNVIMDTDSDFDRRSYSGSVVYQLDFTHEMFGKKLRCQAETELPDGETMELPQKVVSASLEGLVDEPTVRCTNNTAGLNDRQVLLKCVVSNEPKMKSYYFRLRDNMLYPGNQTPARDEVYVEEYDQDNTAYVLKLYEIERWHYTDDLFFMILGYDGTVYQYNVYLFNGNDDDTVGSASMLSSSLLCCVFALVLRSFV